MTSTPLHPVAASPSRPTPAWLYIAGILSALLVGSAAAYPKILLVLIILATVVALLVAGVRNPWVGLSVIIAQYPIINTLRTIYTAHHLPVFAGGVRFLPDFLQFVIIAQLMVYAIKDKRFRLQIFPDDIPVVTYIVIGAYSVIIALQYTHPYGPMNGWYLSITPAIFYLVIRWLKPTAEQGMRFLNWMILCYCVVLVPSLYVYIVRPEWYMILQHAEHGFFVPEGMDKFAFWRFYPRMEAFLFEENHWGTLSELVAVLSAAYLIRSPALWKRYLLMIAAATCMVLSISRGAMISFIIAMVILLLHSGKHRRNLTVALLVLFALADIGLFVLRDSPIVLVTMQRLDTVGADAAEKGEVANDRTHQWRAGWKIFEQMPSGMGLGTVGNGASLSKMTPFLVGDGVYVRVLAEQGVPGICAFAYLIISIPWILWRYRDVAPEEWRPLGIGLFAFHIGFCVHGIGANTFDYYCVAPVYFMLLGLYVSAVHRRLGEQAVAPRYIPLLPAHTD